jgi:predicted transcriptional regulator
MTDDQQANIDDAIADALDGEFATLDEVQEAFEDDSE